MSLKTVRSRSLTLLIALLAARLLLGAVYTVTIPLWEANDEPFHYRFARFLAAERRLPSPEERAAEMEAAEGLGQFSQPPLYYLLIAPIVALFDPAGDPVPGPAKPLPACGELPISANIYLHPHSEDFPWRGAALAAHLARLVSTALVTAAAWLTWMAARVAWPDHPALALGAAGIVAFWPQFLFIGSIVNNDSMIIFAGALFLLFAMRMVAARPRLRDVAGMAVALGMSILSKVSGVALVAPAALALVAWLIRASARNRRARLAVIVALATTLIVAAAALALVRGWVFAAEPGQRYVGAIQAFFWFIENPSALASKLRWERLPAILSETFWTFIAAYGWQNVQISAWVYTVFGAWMLVALAGVLASFMHHLSDKSLSEKSRTGGLSPLSEATRVVFRIGPKPQTRGISPLPESNAQRRRAAWLPLLLMLTVVLSVTLVSLYRSLIDARLVAAGRYFAPAVSALGVIFALGWAALPLPLRSGVQVRTATMLAPVLLIAIWAPFLYIWPTYAPPPRLSVAQFAALPEVTPADARFENGIALLGYRVETPTVTAGETVTLTLYLTTDRRIDVGYMTSLVAIGLDGQGYGFCQSTPGRDQYPTFRWQPGEVIEDRYRVPIHDNFPAPATGFFSLSFYLPETGARLALVDAEGRRLDEYFHFGFDSYRVEAPARR